MHHVHENSRALQAIRITVFLRNKRCKHTSAKIMSTKLLRPKLTCKKCSDDGTISYKSLGKRASKTIVPHTVIPIIVFFKLSDRKTLL